MTFLIGQVDIMASKKSGTPSEGFSLVRFLGAKMWREAEKEAIANHASSDSWGDKRYWELEFKAAFDKCEQYNIPEADLKVCTSDGFWTDVELLARQKMGEELSTAEHEYWASVLAKALNASEPDRSH